ncbi:MAG: hypothetical protein HZA53_05380 [Planctomycetes bacterium]|nr:hypothetical protein [Planctomycetota bacterium]
MQPAFLAAFLVLVPPVHVAQAPAPAAPKPAPTADAPAFVKQTKIMPDGVTMTADWYPAEKARAGRAPEVVIVACHMARASRAEYRAIAPKFGALGWDVLAIDQRSGEKFGDVVNETAKSATTALGGTQGFQAAYGDLAFAVQWARELAPGAKVVLLGSSYSASLAVRYATSVDGKADLVLAFSPSECLNDWTVANDAKSVRVPVFVTCGDGEREKKNAEPIAEALPASFRRTFWPAAGVKAKHGAQSLLVADAAAGEAVWKAVREQVGALVKPR